MSTLAIRISEDHVLATIANGKAVIAIDDVVLLEKHGVATSGEAIGVERETNAICFRVNPIVESVNVS
jgi:hypothetical protein